MRGDLVNISANTSFGHGIINYFRKTGSYGIFPRGPDDEENEIIDQGSHIILNGLSQISFKGHSKILNSLVVA